MGVGAIAGAAGAYFLDPENGKTRRAVAKERLGVAAQRSAEAAPVDVSSVADQVAGKAKGAAAKAKGTATPSEPPANEQALADRVRSEIFRPEGAPKDSVNVNVEDGIVYLRGEATGEEAEALVAAAKDVNGVRGVENLLHAAGEDAPKKEETAAGTRRRVKGSDEDDS